MPYSMINRYRNRFIAFFILSICGSCLEHRQGMYLSPMNSQSGLYHTIPFKSDSLKSAVYGSLIYTTGTANDKGKDWIHAGQASIYRSHNLGNFQAFYGANITLGVYGISEFYNSNYTAGQAGMIGGSDQPIDTFYHIPAHNYSFGSYGISGGINGVKSSGRTEWRYLGFETTLQNEFGDYYSFRKNLQDSAANIIFKHHLTGTIGIYTDALWRNNHKTQFGFKFALNMLMNPTSNYSRLNTYSIFLVSFFSTTFHITANQFIGFMQGNFGTKAASFQIGTSYRLGK
jgi:hypothetical protein